MPSPHFQPEPWALTRLTDERLVRIPSNVRRDPALRNNEPRAGQWIVVHALRDTSGQLIASRIESGREREMRSTPDALAIWLRETAGLRIVSIEGHLTGSRERPQLAGLSLEFRPGHSRAHGALGERLEPGARIRVEGRVTPEHVLLIERPIVIQPPGRAEPEERPTPSSRVAPKTAPPRPQTQPPGSKHSDQPRPVTIDRPPHRPSAPP